MKTRLIYILIGLMVISLVGIIVLQTQWVSGAISEREKEFSARVNSALNDVNETIGEEEAAFFLKSEFGDMDSVFHNMIVIDEAPLDHEDSLIIKAEHSEHIEISIDNDEERIVHRLRGPSFFQEHGPRLEMIIDEHDTSYEARLELDQIEEGKFEQIRSAVRRYTFEKRHLGQLEDRISMETITASVKKSLHKEGLSDKVEIGVLNLTKSKTEPGFSSKSFDFKRTEDVYKKELFPKDRYSRYNYELNLQFDGDDDFVWSGIRSMVFLSVAFTILILICFGYSLYFIFKQKRISQIKNDFINNMTHELKTPLASISLAAASIEHPKIIGTPEEVSKFVDVIKSEERRINAHVERVLDIAALDNRDLKMDLANHDLISVIKQSTSNVALALNNCDGKITFKSDLESAIVSADEFHLVNVFTNILDNSIKYCKEKLEIVIELSGTANSYTIHISDNGIGMKKKSQKLAFDKFYREETGNMIEIDDDGERTVKKIVNGEEVELTEEDRQMIKKHKMREMHGAHMMHDSEGDHENVEIRVEIDDDGNRKVTKTVDGKEVELTEEELEHIEQFKDRRESGEMIFIHESEMEELGDGEKMIIIKDLHCDSHGEECDHAHGDMDFEFSHLGGGAKMKMAGLDGEDFTIVIVMENYDEEAEVEEKMKINTSMDSFEVYPNPNDGTFNLRFSQDEKAKTQIVVVDASGKVVFEDKLGKFSGTYDKEIDLKQYGAGTYIVSVQKGDSKETRKVVVK